MQTVINDAGYIPFLRQCISAAKKFIYISSFKIEIISKPRGRKLKELFEDLISKAKNGVDVKLLINWHNDRRSVAKTNLFASHYLRKNGIAIRHLKNNRCCHSKLFIFDESTAVIGSHNLSIRSCGNNFEISLMTDDAESIKELSSIFIHSWQDAQLF